MSNAAAGKRAMNHYEALEVSPNASGEVIRAAYKSLMQRYHPDKNPGNAALAERAARVAHAYDVLSNAERRAAYDFELKALSVVPAAAAGVRRRHVAAGSAARRPPVPREGNFWHVLFMVVFIALVAWLASWSVRQWLFGGTSAVPAGTTSAAATLPHRREVAGESATAVPHGMPGNGQPAVLRETLLYATQLNVSLRKSYNPGELSGRVLTIPELSVTLALGEDGSSNVARKRTMNFDISSIVARLADARYEELLGVDGERYLKRKISEAIVSGPLQGPVFATSAAEHNAWDSLEGIEVLLPRSFTVE